MTNARKPLVTVSLGRREVRPLLTAALLLAVPFQLSSETLTLSTTYPSPSGIYNQIVTTGGGGKPTTLARDAGQVVIGGSATTAVKLAVNGATALNGAAIISGAVGIGTTNVGTNNLAVSGTTKLDAANITTLAIGGIAFPAPPTGKMEWASMVLTSGTDVDAYIQGVPYNAPNHSDTCNGNVSGNYTCGAAENKMCVDVQLVSAAVSATSASCTWGGWNNKAGGMDDTCNDHNYTYDTCDKTCTDVDCTDWVAGSCINRSWRSINYTPGTSGSPAKYKDVAVQCNTATSKQVMALVAAP